MHTHKNKNPRTSRYKTAAAPTLERRGKMGGFRREYIKVNGAVVKRYRARWATPLDLYHDQQLIDAVQHQAGVQFGQSYNLAVSSEPACLERSRRIDSPAMLNTSDDLQLALAYVEQAYDALTADTVGVVIDVCAYERPVEHAIALNSLRKGLGCLAQAWGMAATDICSGKKG